MINELELEQPPKVKAKCIACMDDEAPGYDFLLHFGIVHVCRKCVSQLTKSFLDYVRGTE